MNLKHIFIILIILGLFFSISVISASENTTDALSETDNVDLTKNNVENPIHVNESTATATESNSTDSQISQTNKTSQIKTKVSAPAVFKVYKKKGTFKVTVKDSKKNPIKKLNLNVKVYTGKKVKTYKVKTNSKGVATINTQKLKIGNHKVVITSANKDYNVNKKSYIHIGKKKTLTLKINRKKDFKNGDYFLFFKQTKNGQYQKGAYVENLRIYKGGLCDAKTHYILKVKYTFKNIKGMKITKTSTSHEMFKTKLIVGYEPVSAKITYIQT
ncbi:hypothetical protein [Methanobrevibacter sp.]